MPALAAADMRQLDQRLSIRAMLKPLSREEVEACIARRLWVAGGLTAVTFEKDAQVRADLFEFPDSLLPGS